MLGNEIISATNSITGESLPPSRWGIYRTVDNLFAFIDSVGRDSEATVTATYDSLYGYPTWIFVDPKPLTADDEYGLSLQHFTPLPHLPASMLNRNR